MYEMVRLALEEVVRFGITVGIYNCEGWSTTGGPWIELGNSMKQCAWSKTIISGGESKYLFPRPTEDRGFYEDIKVFAYLSKKVCIHFSKPSRY